jgi:outer membrane scaffolding protein for murein synthesis (MipA/OmpV family)
MKRLAAACCALAASAAAAASLPLWEAGVVAGAVSTPAYPASDDRSTRALALPYLIYRGKVFRSDQSGIGARLVDDERFEFDIGFAASLPARADDVPARRGMPNLGTLGEFGPRVRITLARPDARTRLRVDLPVRAVLEARGGIHHRGWITEPRLLWETRSEDARWTADVHAAASFGDRAINGYFYDVAFPYVTAERPQYTARAGLLETRVGASASYALNRDVRVFGYTRLEYFGASPNKSSPLYRRDTGLAAGIGVIWILGRSSLPAAD